MKQKLSVTILCKNGERRLREVLEALKNFDDIVIVDSGSTDQSQKIAESFPNVAFHSVEFQGFGKTHNRATDLAKNDWILSIDCDEVVTEKLAEEIQALELDPHRVYALPFLNFFNGKKIKWCGWYPEKHVRLYNRTRTHFSEAMVHEGVITEGMKEVCLRHYVHHFSYDTLSDFLLKMEHYSTLFASQNQGKKRSSPGVAVRHGTAAFLKSYILKRGFLGGYEGFFISTYNGYTSFYKYLKLYHANKKCS